MKLNFLAVSSKLPSWLSDLAGEYERKISFWLPSEHRLLSGSPLGREAKEKKISVESEAILESIKTDDFVILCDEKGRSFDSAGFSKWWENCLNSGKKRIVIVIGGAYGVNDAVKHRADFTWRLSEMTLNHHLALAVACEQVYRAMTMIRGVSYHNA